MMRNLLFACLTITLPLAHADTVQSKPAELMDRRLRELEERVGKLESLPAGNTPPANVEWGPGIVYRNDTAGVRLRLGFRAQQDWAFFSSVDKSIRDTFGESRDTVDFRRILLELEGTVAPRTPFSAQIDLAGGRSAVNNLFIGFDDVPVLGAVRIGSQLEPFGLDELTSNAHLTFAERSLSVFHPGYNAGVRMGRTLVNHSATFSAGVFRETDESGRLASNDGYHLTARATAVPWSNQDDTRLFHAGLAVSRRQPPDGFVQFRARPENRWAPVWLSVTNLATDQFWLAGLESALIWNSFSFQSEAIAAVIDRETADHTHFGGYYVQTSYFPTGERRRYQRTTATFGRVDPRRPFGANGIGAWEIALRLSEVDLNGAEIEGGRMRNWTIGINWYVNSIARLTANLITSSLTDAGDAVAFLLRAQVAF